MTRLYGWGPTAERVGGDGPHGHGKTATFPAAVRLGGLFAPLVADGAPNGERFPASVCRRLAPSRRPGDSLVMDNLPAHKAASAAAAARVACLPWYTPDFNPIGQVFSKIKNELRRRERRAIPDLEHAFGESLDWITRTDARNDFRHAGCPPDRN